MDSMLDNPKGAESAAAALCALGRFGGAPLEFWTAYIDAVGSLCRARRALLVTRKEGVWRTFGQWPPRVSGLPGDGAQAQRLADRAAQAGFAAEEGGAEGPACAMRLDGEADTPAETSVLVLLFASQADAAGALLTEVLLLAADIPRQYEQRRSHRRAQRNAERLLELMATLTRLGDETHFMKAALAVCNDSFSKLTNQTAGFLVELLAKPGQTVRAGQPLVRLANAEIDPDIRSAEMQRQQLLAQERRAESTMVADLAPLREQRAAVEKALADLRRRRDGLLVTAPIAGVWNAPDMATGIGRWLPRGTSLGMIVDNSAHRFVAVVPQVATHVFDDDIRCR